MTSAQGLSAVYQLAHDFVEKYAALDPTAATGMGVPGHETEITDYSPAGQEALIALYRVTLAELEVIPAEGERDRVAKEAMGDGLRLRLDFAESGEYRQNLSIIRSPALSIRRVFDLMPKETAEDWQVIAERLGKVPHALASFEVSLREGMRRGETAARRQAEQNVQQAETWAGLRSGLPGCFDALVLSVRAKSFEQGLPTAIEGAAATATNAYGELAAFLKDTYLDAARERDGVGRERYALGARFSNGIELNLDETYAWGWDELGRIESELEKTAERIRPGAGLDAAVAFLETDPARAVEGVEAFREWLQGVHDEAIDDLQGVHFDIPEAIRKVEAMIPPPGGALAASYTGPSEDLSRPGRTWWPIADGQTRFPKWNEVSTAYHEGVPGHHFQIATTRYLRDELSRYQRLMGGTSGYVEGWALYAERLMGELGYLENPDYYLGMLSAQAMRAARIVVDIGMHLELTIPSGERYHPAKQWTAELAEMFLHRRGKAAGPMAKSEIVRYLGTGASNLVQGGGALLAGGAGRREGRRGRFVQPEGLARAGAEPWTDGSWTDEAGAGRRMSQRQQGRRGASRALAPVLIVVPSLVSGVGMSFLLVAFLVNQRVVQDVFLCVGAGLLWLDFFLTMAIFRYSVRNIDRRLREIEERLDR